MKPSYISVFVVSIFCCTSLLSQNCLTYNIDYAQSIPLLKQPSDNSCWLTVTAMMLSWKNKHVYSMEQLADTLGEPWRSLFENDSGLPDSLLTSFKTKIGLTAEPPANHLLKVYVDWLKNYGPVWITTGNGFIAHVRLLVGISGDGGYETTDFHFIDPELGKIVSQKAIDFMKAFEAEAYIANDEGWPFLRTQILHF